MDPLTRGSPTTTMTSRGKVDGSHRYWSFCEVPRLISGVVPESGAFCQRVHASKVILTFPTVQVE